VQEARARVASARAFFTTLYGHLFPRLHRMANTRPASDVQLIVCASLLFRSVTVLLLFSAYFLVPTWDTGGRLLLQERGSSILLEPLLRWDTLYFSRIALDGYAQEKDFAFAPGLPLVMRLGAQLVAWGTGWSSSLGGAIVFGSFMSVSMSTVAAVLLYKCPVFPFRGPFWCHGP
jgi:Mannosyltransferase (PIG-V)